MDRLDGLDTEMMEQEKENRNVISLEETKKKRNPFHYWTVNGVEHKLKLTTGMITKLENKYRTNIMNLVATDGIPPLSVMLTIIQAAMIPWEHGTNIEKVNMIYDRWLEEGGSQSQLLPQVVMPVLAVSGFFTETQTASLMKDLEESMGLM